MDSRVLLPLAGGSFVVSGALAYYAYEALLAQIAAEDYDIRVWPPPAPIPHTLWTEALAEKSGLTAAGDTSSFAGAVAAGYSVVAPWSSVEQAAFIHAHFPAAFLAAYRSLTRPSHRSDLWRYCVLYVRGGVFVDADGLKGARRPLAELFQSPRSAAGDYTWFAALNAPRDGMLTSVLASPPHNPLLLELAERIASHVPACNAQARWTSRDFWRVVRQRYAADAARAASPRALLAPGATGPAMGGAGTYGRNGSLLVLWQEDCSGGKREAACRAPASRRSSLGAARECCTLVDLSSNLTATPTATATASASAPLFSLPRSSLYGASSGRRMALVARGEIFRVGGMKSRRTSGDGVAQAACFASEVAHIARPLRRLGWEVRLHADVACANARHAEARVLL